ncbi:MAG: M20/M25/M40 family metallo-hydrolase [Bacteroidales bacterium]
MKRRISNIVLIVCSFLLILSCSGPKTAVTVGELSQHIKYLSSDSLRGRQTGKPGDSLAAEYIREKFAGYKLVPVTGDGLQRFKVTSNVTAGVNNSLTTGKITGVQGVDFMPFSFSANGSLESDVVFAGYGFNIDNDSTKWSDYKGIDVKGKWLLILRGDPESEKAVSRYAPFSGDRDKALLAKDMGAGGVILVSGEAFEKDDAFDPMTRTDYSVGIPAIRVKRSVADALVSSKSTTISDLEKKLNKNLKPASFMTGQKLAASTDVVHNKVNTRNVVMMLPGEDPVLKDEYVVFGAHFDHLGMGGQGSSSRKPDTIAVHHGADDNASGVAMLIELAGKFAGTKNSHSRTLVFIAFSGEESGLLGSKYFTENPLVDLKKTDLMVNCDMVGRLNEEKNLQIGGVGTAPGLKERAEAPADTSLLKLSFTEEGSGPSDHSSFYAMNIPVLYFTTGAHSDYHTPQDTWDKINYEGMVTVSDLIYKVTSAVANDTVRLAFRESGPKSDVSRGMRRRGITLGIMPDFSGSSTNGLRVDLVTAGKPAAIGGMKKGDIITAIENKAVNNIEDYMFRLGQLKKGQRITVDIIRNGKKEVLIIQL